jgi:GGDEF domain-containing protein
MNSTEIPLGILRLLYAGLIAIAVILALYFWSRTLKVAFEDCQIQNKQDQYIAILDISALQYINRKMGFLKADTLISNIANTISQCEFKNSQSYSLYGGKFSIIAQADKQEDFTQKINRLIILITQSNDQVTLHSGQ